VFSCLSIASLGVPVKRTRSIGIRAPESSGTKRKRRKLKKLPAAVRALTESDTTKGAFSILLHCIVHGGNTGLVLAAKDAGPTAHMSKPTVIDDITDAAVEATSQNRCIILQSSCSSNVEKLNAILRARGGGCIVISSAVPTAKVQSWFCRVLG